MNLRHTLTLLATITAVAVLNISVWTVKGYASSRSVDISSVKGISTEPLVTLASTPKSQLGTYPLPLPAAPAGIAAKEYVLYHVESGRIVVQSSNLDPVPIASTTKLMTAHLVSRLAKPEEIVTVSPEAASITGSLMNIHSGEKISVDSLLHGLLLVSGNDAGHALAEFVGGKLLGNPAASSEAKTARFVDEMNLEANRLYMTSTHYKDPVGLNDEGRSNALDLAKIASLDLQDTYIQPIMNTGDATVYSQNQYYRYDLHNSDRLIEDAPFEGTIGGKTGFTPDAGHCLVSAAKRGGQTFIAVILNTNVYDNEASAVEARKLLTYGFAHATYH